MKLICQNNSLIANEYLLVYNAIKGLLAQWQYSQDIICIITNKPIVRKKNHKRDLFKTGIHFYLNLKIVN